MTAVTVAELAHVVRRAAIRATLAPSIHNTQPWRLALGADSIDIHADDARQLRVLDPRGRQLVISCGCALFNARVAIAGEGHNAVVSRLPAPHQPELLASVTVGATHPSPLARLDEAVTVRRTNRRAYLGDPVDQDVVDLLVAAAAAEQTTLIPITDPEQRVAIAELTRRADQIENADPAYLAELHAWTTDDPRRRDGVPASTVPYLGEHPHTEQEALPIRGFDSRGMGWLPQSARSDAPECLLLFAADRDEPMSWLRAGEALERVWLELTLQGLWASPLTQVVEVRETHNRLRELMGTEQHPQLLLRVGRAPNVAASPRRRLDEVLIAPSDGTDPMP